MCKNWAHIQSSQRGPGALGSCVMLERPLLCMSPSHTWVRLSPNKAGKAHFNPPPPPKATAPLPTAVHGVICFIDATNMLLFSGETEYFGSDFIPCLGHKCVYKKIRRRIHDDYSCCLSSRPQPPPTTHTHTHAHALISVRLDETLSSQNLSFRERWRCFIRLNLKIIITCYNLSKTHYDWILYMH